MENAEVGQWFKFKLGNSGQQNYMLIFRIPFPFDLTQCEAKLIIRGFPPRLGKIFNKYLYWRLPFVALQSCDFGKITEAPRVRKVIKVVYCT